MIPMTIQNYIDKINTNYKSGQTTEHSFRPVFQNLLEALLPDVLITNEPKHQAIGAPDYILTKKEIPVGYIETKILGADLHNKAYTEQFDRYKTLPKLIITNYLDFEVYEYANLITTLSIGEKRNGKIISKPENFNSFETAIKNFAIISGQTIKSPENLAKMMANNARVLADVINKALGDDIKNESDSALNDQLKAFQDILIHDLQPKEFSDIYAQTIAYGMFSARLHDTSLESFTRREAAELIPKSNPFLRNLFDHIAGIDLDKRILWIVNALVDIFRATDVKALLKNFGKANQQKDPIIYFYETFLSEYDPALRKSMGVWYTPEQVVKFIVRAVDDVLLTNFNLKNGIANTDKVKIKVAAKSKATADQRSKLKDSEQIVEVHKVQILDPATGTGTFLAEVVKHIYRNSEEQKGAWNSYVENHLLPRLNGFELLMASYAMAHLKLDMLLTQTGYKPKDDQRLRIYLTNSLEEHHPDTGTLFASMLSREANEANFIKRDVPVMIVMGNPPYLGESTNKGEWIMKLMEDYKKEPGGTEKLKEKNPKWLNNDYVKFIRYGQYFIEKNGEGILAFINPHAFLDNPTYRGMRWNLLKTYDKIYTLDLHGNSKKKEKANAGIDRNVFDITEGVSINLFIKTGEKKPDELGKVFHFDLFGQRELKFKFLLENSIATIPFQQLPNVAPNYFFVPKNFDSHDDYSEGFAVSVLFPLNSAGIVTARDSFTIQDSKEKVELLIKEFLSLSTEDARVRFELGKDVRDWTIDFAKSDILSSGTDFNKIIEILYRPFDCRYTYYTGKSRGFHCMPRGEVMKHFIRGENLALTLCKQFKTGDKYVHSFITNRVIESGYVSNRTSEITSLFPLYKYPETTGQMTIDQSPTRVPNLDMVIVQKIADNLGLVFTNEKETVTNTFAPIDILDYIYAVLFSPKYRERYKAFLKIDFPRIPYPTNQKNFWELVKFGRQLRELHLLEHPTISKFITQYPIGGTNIVSKVIFDKGRVYINDSQYFANVPEASWDFYIGGYQPAQKWLKDRKERELSFEDISHYQKIIVALADTKRLMDAIDTLDFLP